MEASTQLPGNRSLWQTTLGWQPNDQQLSLFQQLYDGILAANQTLNLTRITHPTDFWEKHLWDSLSGIAPWLGQPVNLPLDLNNRASGLAVIDIGTGGGFPGIPVAIACPNWSVTLLDSTQKKMRFLQTLGQTLGLTHIAVVTERAEAVGHQPIHREAYDLALIRAVGPAATCAEYALPLLKPGGQAVLYRGQWSATETAALNLAVSQLGGELAQIYPWCTPITAGQRHCVVLNKTHRTLDKFPRAVGIPAKFPLTAME
ncbi:MAG: 16S rRNA (guanine(527)-N(7))-methyltransferase RsmG [Cyanobacteria bacterium P01_A01_bin.123]